MNMKERLVRWGLQDVEELFAIAVEEEINPYMWVAHHVLDKAVNKITAEEEAEVKEALHELLSSNRGKPL